MRINPINNSAYSFKGIMSTNPSIPKEVFGDKKDIVDYVSDAKQLDVWTFKFGKGGMYNPSSRYTVMVRDKNSNILREMADVSDSEEDMEKLRDAVEGIIVHTNPSSNYAVCEGLLKSSHVKNNPAYGRQITERLLTAYTPEDNTIMDEVFGDRKDIINFVCKEKNLDIEIAEDKTSTAKNPRYIATIKDKDSNTLKVISDVPDTEKDLRVLRKRMEAVIIWADAPSNLSVLEAFKKSGVANTNPEYGMRMASRLLEAQMSNEAKIWQVKLQML